MANSTGSKPHGSIIPEADVIRESLEQSGGNYTKGATYYYRGDDVFRSDSKP